MSRGVVIIGIGEAYLRMATALAYSIKNKSKGIQICLITDREKSEITDVFNGKNCLEAEYFQRLPGISMLEKCFYLKLCLNAISPFDETIYLDADSIVLPGKSINHWFDLLQNVDFTAYCNVFWDVETETYSRPDKYTMWIDPKKLAVYYDLRPPYGVIPVINSSFLYFRNHNEKVDRMFKMARQVFEDSDLPCDKYQGAKPDEVCFNAACALTGLLPHQSTFRPVFMSFASENQDEAYIMDHYSILSAAGRRIPKDIESIYDKYVNYYEKSAGLTSFSRYQDKFYKMDKSVFVPTEKKNYVATIYLTGSLKNWNNFPAQPNISLIEDWARSLAHVGLTGIVFHNCFNTKEIESFAKYPVHFSYVEMPFGHNSGLFRYEIYAEFIQKYQGMIEGIFCTDSTDLEFLKNPFTQPKFDKSKLYIGCESWTVEYCMKDRGAKFVFEACPEFMERLKNEPDFKNNTVLNAGLVGGAVEVITPFIIRMAKECHKFRKNPHFQDMGVMNVLGYGDFKDHVYFGPQLNTQFNHFDKYNSYSWVRHK